MTREMSFFIDGCPITQGSLSFKGQGKGHHSAKLKDWRKYVALVASQHWKGVSIAPFEAGFVFILPDHRRRDIDKLLRAMLDALTGVVWADDAQVMRIGPQCEKQVGDTPGVWVFLREMENGDAGTA